MRFVLLFLSLFVCINCDPGFPDRSLIDGYRVLGMVADPPEVGPFDMLELTLIEANAEDAEYEWTACLASLGSSFGFQCVDESLEVPLPIDGPVAAIDLSSDGIDFLSTLLKAFAEVERADASETDGENEGKKECGEACQTRDGEKTEYIDIQFMVTSGPPAGRQVTTVKLVRIYFDDSERNQNPQILRFERSSTSDIRPGENVRFEYEVNTDLHQTYTLVNGIELTEENIMTWYTSAGTFTPAPGKEGKEKNISIGSESEMFLQLPADLDVDRVTVWGVLRDERGGTDFRTLELEVSQ
jgi:hypothetical protein